MSMLGAVSALIAALAEDLLDICADVVCSMLRAFPPIDISRGEENESARHFESFGDRRARIQLAAGLRRCAANYQGATDRSLDARLLGARARRWQQGRTVGRHRPEGTDDLS